MMDVPEYLDVVIGNVGERDCVDVIGREIRSPLLNLAGLMTLRPGFAS